MQFRSISLCNVIYKITAKVIVNRMSELLNFCVHESQGAFILGCQISGNVLIAYKLLNILKHKNGEKKGNFTLKLDLSKTYDRVEWDFLAGMMLKLGFHVDWITLVMRCVVPITYTVGINGCRSNSFTPSIGLR